MNLGGPKNQMKNFDWLSTKLSCVKIYLKKYALKLTNFVTDKMIEYLSNFLYLNTYNLFIY